MSISDTLKNHIVIVVSTASIAGFTAGWSAHKSSVEAQGQEQILKSRRVELESFEAKYRNLNQDHDALLDKYRALLPALPTSRSEQANLKPAGNANKPQGNAEVAVGRRIGTSIVTGSAILRDGSIAYDQSGIKFSSLSVVPWNAQGDLLAHKQGSPSTTGFFLSFDAEPYKDPGGRAGIVQVKGKALSDITECPTAGYTYHWFLPRVDGIYCVRTRSGRTYAVLQVTKMAADSIEFDFMHQENGKTTF